MAATTLHSRRTRLGCMPARMEDLDRQMSTLSTRCPPLSHTAPCQPTMLCDHRTRLQHAPGTRTPYGRIVCSGWQIQRATFFFPPAQPRPPPVVFQAAKQVASHTRGCQLQGQYPRTQWYPRYCTVSLTVTPKDTAFHPELAQRTPWLVNATLTAESSSFSHVVTINITCT